MSSTITPKEIDTLLSMISRDTDSNFFTTEEMRIAVNSLIEKSNNITEEIKQLRDKQASIDKIRKYLEQQYL